jgi:hypothetical protein
MVDVTPFLPGLSPVPGKAVVARFDGGRHRARRLSRRVDTVRMRVADRCVICIGVGKRANGTVRHTQSPPLYSLIREG